MKDSELVGVFKGHLKTLLKAVFGYLSALWYLADFQEQRKGAHRDIKSDSPLQSEKADNEIILLQC